MRIFLVKEDGEVKTVSALVKDIKEYLDDASQKCKVEEWGNTIKRSTYTAEEFRIAVLCGSLFRMG